MAQNKFTEFFFFPIPKPLIIKMIREGKLPEMAETRNP